MLNDDRRSWTPIPRIPVSYVSIFLFTYRYPLLTLATYAMVTIPVPLFFFSCFTSFLPSINTYCLPIHYSQSLTTHLTESKLYLYYFS